MIRISPFLIILITLSLSCKHEKEPEPFVHVAAIDHIRWGSKNNPLEGVTISWRSNGKSDKIKWGYTGNFEIGEFIAETDSDYVGSSNKHEYKFDSLNPSSIVYYRLYDSSDSCWTNEKTFKTASDPTNNHFKFTAGGDSRTNLDDWHIVSEAIEVCDFSLYLGDITTNGTLNPVWENWYLYGENFISNNLVFHSRGNHDIGDKFGNNLVNPGNGLYYSFGFGNSIFIGLDFLADETWDQQALFLENVLKNNKNKTWKFVFFHAPFFTSGRHEGEMDALRTTWWKIFDDYGVDFVFNAHEHSYLRTVPINLNVSDTGRVEEYGSGPNQGRCQIISGQYGAPAYSKHEGWFVAETFVRMHYTTIEVNGTELELKAIDAQTGEVFDRLILKK
jgi:hypothetical protein